MKQKILYLVTEDWYFWSHRLHLAEAALRNNYQVSVATNRGKYTESIQARGFEFIPISIHRSIGSIFKEIRTFVKLINLYRRNRPDLVHHIALKSILIGTLSARLCRVPHVVNSYTGLGFLFTGGHSKKAYSFIKILLRLAAFLFNTGNVWSIVQNPDDEKDLEKIGLISRKRSTMIRGSGIDLSVFSYSDEQDGSVPVVLFASRLLKNKGIREFIEAADAIRKITADARFVVAGDIDAGNPTSIDRAQLDKWIQDGCIEYWGYRDDMVPVYRQAHIVCFPSYREGLPKVLLEAAATGRPLIAFDVPGCREIVRHDWNGLLVPLNDVPGLASSITRLLADKQLRIDMGRKGRSLVEKEFSVDVINKQTLDLYRQILS